MNNAASGPPGPHIVALLSDLMATVQLEGPARAGGWTLVTIAGPAALRSALAAEKPALALLDLADPAFSFAETYRAIREEAPQARIVAIYPHIRDELATMARQAGCEIVMPRSRFFMNPAGAIATALAPSTPAQA